MLISVETTLKPNQKFDGGKWFSYETLYKSLSEYFNKDNNQFLCKGNGTSGTQIYSICIDKYSRIGKIQSNIFEDCIIVDIDENRIPNNIIKAIVKRDLKANMRMIITKVNPLTNEILDMKIICYDLIYI